MTDNRKGVSSTSGSIFEVIEGVISWIEANLSTNINCAIAAEKSGYTRWYFQRKFREIKGDSLQNHIRKKKAENALEQIINSDCSLPDIARNNGFGSELSLTRAIKRYYAATPSQLRSRVAGCTYCSYKQDR